MKISFNTVTWYSKLAAVIVFVGLVPALMFYIGKEYGEVTTLAERPAYVAPEHPVVAAPKAVSAPAQLKFFALDPHKSDYSTNVVGYFAYGNFLIDMPRWVIDYWKETNLENGGMKFAVVTDEPVDFGDITIALATTTEIYNAETLYMNEFPASIKRVCISGARCEIPESDVSIVTSEILIGTIGDTRIYHIARLVPHGQIQDSFFIDGKELTATVHFSSSKENYSVYEAKVKEFVQGIGKGGAVRG